MKNLKELRKYNNLRQRDVAQHIGVSDRVYAYYEQGRTLPAKYVKPLANLFGISCDEFLENTENPLVWEKEFGCIERTERLEMPTWEEFNKFFNNEVTFYDKNNNSIRLTRRNDILLWTSSDNGKYLFQKPRTKENYTLACRKAKELFLGLGEKK